MFPAYVLHWEMMQSQGKLLSAITGSRRRPVRAFADWVAWLPQRAAFETASASSRAYSGSQPADMWWYSETRNRVNSLLHLVRDYLPWSQTRIQAPPQVPELGINSKSDTLSISAALCRELEKKLMPADAAWASFPAARHLPRLASNCASVAGGGAQSPCTRRTARHRNTSDRLAENTEFGFLVDPDRQVLSHRARCRNRSHSRRLLRHAGLRSAHRHLPRRRSRRIAAAGLVQTRPRSHLRFWPLHTALLDRHHVRVPDAVALDAQLSAHAHRTNPIRRVAVQRAYAQSLGIPWGISESAKWRRTMAATTGTMLTAFRKWRSSTEATAGPVISPYSTFLALGVDLPAAVLNIRKMTKHGWLGAYGFYEAADYRESQRKPVLAHQWMAHHQGMSLLAIANVLCDNAVQRWFHANAIVQAAERLLHEAAVSKGVLKSRLYELAPLRAR